MSRINELERDESKAILAFLYSHMAQERFQVRHKWDVNDMAFWDNRACQHFAASDYFPHVRRMERVTIAGDRPYYDPARAAG